MLAFLRNGILLLVHTDTWKPPGLHTELNPLHVSLEGCCVNFDWEGERQMLDTPPQDSISARRRYSSTKVQLGESVNFLSLLTVESRDPISATSPGNLVPA